MDDNRRDRTPDELRDEHDVNEETGEVLGISRSSGGGETINRPELPEDEERRREDGPRRHVGARDVTEGTTGGTTPDTGGHGVFRRGSGATGTDLGND